MQRLAVGTQQVNHVVAARHRGCDWRVQDSDPGGVRPTPLTGACFHIELSNFWHGPFDGCGEIVLDKPRYRRTGESVIALGDGRRKLRSPLGKNLAAWKTSAQCNRYEILHSLIPAQRNPEGRHGTDSGLTLI